jgi:hypothetical protein
MGKATGTGSVIVDSSTGAATGMFSETPKGIAADGFGSLGRATGKQISVGGTVEKEAEWSSVIAPGASHVGRNSSGFSSSAGLIDCTMPRNRASMDWSPPERSSFGSVGWVMVIRSP